jgi:hypothetical protein
LFDNSINFTLKCLGLILVPHQQYYHLQKAKKKENCKNMLFFNQEIQSNLSLRSPTF